MKRFFYYVVPITLVFHFASSAFGEPVPKFLDSPDAESSHLHIQGNFFGNKPGSDMEPKVLSSVEGLTSCVLLADSPVLDKCGHLETFAIVKWNNYDITFEGGTRIPKEEKDWFLFVLDRQGILSNPIGPLSAHEGKLVLESQTLGLEEETFELGEGTSVKILKPYPVPSAPGTPVVDKVVP